LCVVVGRDLRLGQALTCTHLRKESEKVMSIHRRAGLERHDMADRTSSEYASDKAWNSLLLMPATSSPTGMCSFLLNLAPSAVLSMHHHGRCGVSGSAVQKRSPRSRRCPRAANRQANGGGERDHNVLRASSEFGMQRGPPAHTVAWYARPPPCSLAALSACGGGLEGPCAIASFDAHALPLDRAG
jgi:hypothetical protein